MRFLYISAALVLVAVVAFWLSADLFVDEADLPIEEGGGPYVPAEEDPVMLEEPATE